MTIRISLCLALALILSACDGADPHAGHDHDHGHGHHHTAPHGGTLIVLGDHFAHLELLIDSETGKLSAWVLDGEAQRPIRLKQEQVLISAKPAQANPIPLALAAASNDLTGEKPGDSATFEVSSDRLKGVQRFEGEVVSITIKGSEIQGVKFKYPEGNEDPH